MEPQRTADPAAAMKGRYFIDEVSRTTLSVGLWGGGMTRRWARASSPPPRAAVSVEDGPPEILVTPLSLMTDDHWEALTDLTGAGSGGVGGVGSRA